MTDPKPTQTTRPLPPTRTETKLIEIRPDRVDLPPSVGSSAFENIFFGPLAGQPSRAKAKEEDKPRKSNVIVWILLALFLAAIYFFRNPEPVDPRHIPQPQPRQPWQ